MKTDDLKRRKIELARTLFRFKIERYRRWHGFVFDHMIADARESAAAKYGIDPSDID